MPRMLLALLFSLFAGLALAGTMYKWVDDQGTTHYTDTPPPDRKAQEIQTEPSAPATGPGGAQPAPDNWQEEERQFQRRRAIRKEQQWQEEQAAARAKQQAVARKQSCLLARQNLHALQQGRPVYHIDENGRRTYLDDPARAAAIEQARKDIERYCAPAPEQ